MTRINVYDYLPAEDAGASAPERAGYFSSEAATWYNEATDWNGSNQVSRNTGGQWEHEQLARTQQGRWVLAAYSDYQGTMPAHRYVSDGYAQDWLVLNEHDEDAARYFGPVAGERGPGRPEVGGAVHVRIGSDLIDRLDGHATSRGTTRAKMIRRYVAEGLAREGAITDTESAVLGH